MNDRIPSHQEHFDSLHPEIRFSRRGFIASGAAAGFTMAAGPIMAQQIIRTPMDGLEGGDIMMPSYDKPIPAYVAMPAKAGRYPVVLVCEEIFGVHEHIKDVCRRLAKAGYFAIAPEIFARAGDPAKFTNTGELIKAVVSKVPDDSIMKDFDACVAYAERHKKTNIARLGMTGFCYGGRVVWMYAAHNKALDAGVAWYGSFVGSLNNAKENPIDVADRIDTPILGLYGSADQGIPVATVERMRAGLKAFGKEKSMIHVYEGAPHAFNADYRPSYRKEAADDGWKRMLAWFRKHGV